MATLKFVLAIRPSARYPYYRVRVPGRKIRFDERIFPIVMEIPDAVLRDRKPVTKIVIPTPPPVSAKAEE